jgi:hypothetical protein
MAPIIEYRVKKGIVTNEKGKYPFNDEFDLYYSMSLNKLKKLSKIYEEKLKELV